MKNLLAVVLVISLAFASCDKTEDLFIAPTCDQVSYTFVNDLGVDIDGLVIEGYDTMPLAYGATSMTYCIEEVYGFLPTDPWVNFELDIDGRTICSAALLNWCGTGATRDSSGNYELTITEILVGDSFPITCSEYAAYMTAHIR